MIGEVSPELEAMLRVVIAGLNGGEREVQAVVDTGFNGYLTVPPDMVTALGLRPVGARTAILADGTSTRLGAYLANIRWDGQTRQVVCLAAAGGALVGMQMLRGCRVLLEVIDGGQVAIVPLSSGPTSR